MTTRKMLALLVVAMVLVIAVAVLVEVSRNRDTLTEPRGDVETAQTTPVAASTRGDPITGPEREQGYAEARRIDPYLHTWTDGEIDTFAATICIAVRGGKTYDEIIEGYITSGASDQELQGLVPLTQFAMQYECPPL